MRLLPALLLALATISPTEPWQAHQVYQPEIRFSHVVRASPEGLGYNHDSSIAFFDGKWICLWNGHPIPVEGKPGQLNYMSMSTDAIHWSAPEPAFASIKHSATEIPCPKGTQWQPNLFIYRGRLMASWCQFSKDDYNGAYISTLEKADGKWTHQRLTWNGSPDVTIDGKTFSIFPTQNPVVLTTGRILVPVTLTGPVAADATDASIGEAWWRKEKRSSVLISDDGKNWRVSPGTTQNSRTWAQWEPTVWPTPGAVMMFARNNDRRPAEAGGPAALEKLLWSKSSDGGETWTPHLPVPLETACSRMHVFAIPGRTLMVHHDWSLGGFSEDRRNLSLFFGRDDGYVFTPGVSVTDDEASVAYPQAWVHGKQLVVCYSAGHDYRSIKSAVISPLPEPGVRYLLPRKNRPQAVSPKRMGGALRFSGGQYLDTRETITLGATNFSCRLALRPVQGGVLFDSREADRGFLFSLTRVEKGSTLLAPLFYSSALKSNLISGLRMAPECWHLVGLSVEGPDRVVFEVDGKREVVQVPGAAAIPKGAVSLRLGAKRSPQSQVAGFTGEISWAWFHPTLALSPEEGQHLAGLIPKDGGPPTLRAAPFGLTLLSMFEADPYALMASPQAISEPCAWDRAKNILRFDADGSAGVDMGGNASAVPRSLRFKARLGGGSSQVLATVGDARRAVRLCALENQIQMIDGVRTASLGKAEPGVWFQVELRHDGAIMTASVDGAPEQKVPLAMEQAWFFLGEGYPRRALEAGHAFEVDLASVQSRVGN